MLIELPTATVMALLVELLLPTPEIRGSNPDTGKNLSTNCTLEKTEIKKKRPGMAHHLKKTIALGQKIQNHDVISPMHCLCTCKIVVGLRFHPDHF